MATTQTVYALVEKFRELSAEQRSMFIREINQDAADRRAQAKKKLCSGMQVVWTEGNHGGGKGKLIRLQRKYAIVDTGDINNWKIPIAWLSPA
jgi:hypothetical protein